MRRRLRSGPPRGHSGLFEAERVEIATAPSSATTTGCSTARAPSGGAKRFCADLERRGVAFERSADPVDDPALVDVLAATYVRAPSTFEARVA